MFGMYGIYAPFGVHVVPSNILGNTHEKYVMQAFVIFSIYMQKCLVYMPI